MRLSQMHLHTLREVPAEAEVPSHILLLRTGMIRKLVSGVYGFMPMGWKSIRKIEEIIRQEMNAKGGKKFICLRYNRQSFGWSPVDGMPMGRSFGV